MTISYPSFHASKSPLLSGWRTGAGLRCWAAALVILGAAASASGVPQEGSPKTPRDPGETVAQPWEVRPGEPLNLTALDRPIDAETYRLGPGDELAINIWGRVQGGYPVSITPEVTALVPTVGEISLRGMTLAQAKAAILRRVGEVYPRVEATVTLTRVRTLRVPVTGAVSTPGIYLVSANVRVSEAIEAAGWQEGSSRRRILLLRSGDTVPVDVQRFVSAGDERGNPYVTEGDVVFVPPMLRVHGLCEISGAVNLSGLFEYVPGDRLDEAIKLAFGFTVDADTTALELIRFLGEDSATTKLVVDLRDPRPGEGREFLLRPDDRMYVRPRIGYREKASVWVGGEVLRPGSYAIHNGRTLISEVLRLCGGLTDRADPLRATLLRAGRYQPDVETDRRVRKVPAESVTDAERDWILAYSLSEAGQVSLDLEALLSGRHAERDLPLWDGDVITIPQDLPQVNVIGRVRRPGLIPHAPEQDLAYYLRRAGGLAWRADAGRIFVVRGTTGMPVLKKNMKAIDAGDTIVIPTVREKKFWPVLRDAMVVMGNLATLYLVVDQATK